MKERLLEVLVCPLCGGKLSCESFAQADAGEITTGLLSCVCAAHYPIIAGIPRVLPLKLQPMLWEMHPDFYRSYAAQLPRELLPPPQHQQQQQDMKPEDVTDTDAALTAQLKTAKSFGYEWQAFSEMLPEYELNFRWYFERFGIETFKDKRVLDAGCGTGRHTYHMIRSGAREVIAMDFSQAIEVAAHNNRHHPNAHFVQADIYHPPFPPHSFDFVYSLGVLHHLPDPEKGFRRLLGLLKQDEFINVYLYWNLEGEPVWRRALLAIITATRRVTTRLPHALLQRLSWLIAAFFYIAFVLPARVLARFSVTRSLADRVPLGHYRKYSFRVVYTDQFDRFSAPIENRYGRAQVAEWFERAGLKDVVILGGAGWRASGRFGFTKQIAVGAPRH